MSRQLEPRIVWLHRDFGDLISPQKRPKNPTPHTGRCEYSVVPEGHPAHGVSDWDSQYCQVCGAYDVTLLGF